MSVFIALVAVLQILAGIGVYLVAASAVHEILGAILFGMGTMTLALAVVIDQLRLLSKTFTALHKMWQPPT